MIYKRNSGCDLLNSFAFLTAVFLFLVHCNTVVSGLDTQRVTNVLQTSLECHENPGMAVAVVKDGQTIYSKGFGVTDIDTKKNVTTDTIFSVASITKSFAAALFVKLLHEKTNFTLDSKVKDFLGEEFVMPDKWRTEETTFLDLLSHKTAMLSNNRVRFDNNFTRDTLLSRLRYLPSTRQFRVDYIYNNLVYGLVGRLAELFAGGKMKWEELIDEHIFKPLGMNSSTFTTRIDFNRDDYAHGYWKTFGEQQLEPVTNELSKRWAEICSSGSIKSSVKDMAKYLKFHLTDGKSEDESQVMKANYMNELHKQRYTITKINYLDIQKPTFPITADTSGYALGLRTGTYRGFPMISHTGSTYGYSAYMALLPTEQIGVIALFSGGDRYYRHRTAAAHFLLDSALGVTPYLNETTICSFPYPWITKNLSNSNNPQVTNITSDFSLQEYQGWFSNKGYGNLKIEFNITLKNLVMTYGWGRWELLAINETNQNKEQRFYAKGTAPVTPPDVKSLYFIAHPNDAINAIIGIRATSFESKRPPIFCKQQYDQLCQDIVSNIYPKVEDQSTNVNCSNPNNSGNGVTANLKLKECLLLVHALILSVICSNYLL